MDAANTAARMGEMSSKRVTVQDQHEHGGLPETIRLRPSVSPAPAREIAGTRAAAIGFRGPVYTACHLLTFHNPDGDKVGWMDWQNGELTFGRDMAESATIFFEQVLKPLVEAYFETVREAGIDG